MRRVIILVLIGIGVGLIWKTQGLSFSAPTEPPMSVFATPVGSSEVELNWGIPAHATRYVIWRATGHWTWSTRFHTMTTTVVSATVSHNTYVDMTVHPHTTYTYWIQPYANVWGTQETGPHSAGVVVSTP